MQNVVISATKEGAPSRPGTPATPRSSSLTPKSRRIMELEERNARLEEEKAIIKEENARLEEEKIELNLIRNCEEKIADSDKLLSELKCLENRGQCAMERLKLRQGTLRTGKYGAAAICAVGLAATGGGLAVGYIAATGGVLCTKSLIALGTVSAVTTIPVGALILTLSGVVGGAIIAGIIFSYQNFKEFYENNYKIKITQSQISNLESKISYVNRCEAKVEYQKKIMKNLLNQKEINRKVCEEACISLGNAHGNLDKTIKELKGFVHEIYKNSGGC